VDLRLLRYFVAVAEERHFGRAAARLRIAQPSLSRAVRQLEGDLGAVLLDRSPAGVGLTSAGEVLHDEARRLLEQAERARARVAAAVGGATLTVGTLADSVEEPGTRLSTAFRRRHPGVDVRVRESDLDDPTTGLRAGLVDVALTRAPFDTTGIELHVLRSDPVGAVLRADDPLARRGALHLHDLAGRRWFRFPDGTDPVWSTYWNGGRTRRATGRSSAPPRSASRPSCGTGPSGWSRSATSCPTGSSPSRSSTSHPVTSSSPGAATTPARTPSH